MFVLLKVQSVQVSFRPAGVSLGGGGAKAPFAPLPPPPGTPLLCLATGLLELGPIYSEISGNSLPFLSHLSCEGAVGGGP